MNTTRYGIRRCVLFSSIVSSAALGLLPAPAHAVTTNWIDNSGGPFTTATNWDNGVPDDADIAVFDRGNGITYTVTFSRIVRGDITNDRLVVGSNTVTFNPIGAPPPDYFLDNTTTIEADPILGLPVRGVTIGAQANDTAAVLISHLALLQTVAATLGHVASSNGTLTLDQNNDLFNVTGGSTTNAELIIGRLGIGVLNVSAGADATVNGEASGFPAGNISLGRGSSGQGTANISGAGSTLDTNTLLVVGDAGTGTLNVTAGGLVESLTGILGDLVGSTGTATISGAGSRWNVSFLSVGDAGTGTLNVLDGGTIDITNVGIVDINGGSTLNLDNGTIDGDVDSSGQINVTGPAAITGSLTIAVNASTLFHPAEPISGIVGLDIGGGITNSGTFTLMLDQAEPITDSVLKIADSLTNSGTMSLTIDNAEPINDVVFDIGGGMTNSGTFTLTLDQAEPISEAVLKVAGSLNNSGAMNLTIDYAEPVGVVVVDAAGGITNSGTFTMQIDNAEPVGAVTLALGPGQSFTNNATGVLNLNGPMGVPEGETIDAKYVIGGNVVNNGAFNVRGNTQIAGSLTIGVDASTLFHPAEPITEIVGLDIGGGMTNSGTFTLMLDQVEPINDAVLKVAGSLNNSGAMNLTINYAEPVGVVVVDAAGGITNSGTFTMQIDNAEPVGAVTLALGPGQSFTNNATGVVNLNGPLGVPQGQSIDAKYVIGGNVVNNGAFNVRTNAQVTGSLTTAVDSQTIVHPAEPIAGIVLEVAGGVSNSGSFTMRTNSATPISDMTLELGPGQTFTNNATGVVNLDGPEDVGGAEVIESKHTVGGNVVNHGEMNIRTNAQIGGSLTNSVDADLLIDSIEPCCSATVEITGAVANSGTVTMRTSSAAPISDMALELGPGQAFTNNATGVLQGTGTIVGNVLNRGEVRPGNSSGVLAVTGDFTQEADGTLIVEVGGTTPGSQHDQLAIGGQIALGGLVEVVFAEGFLPQPGNRFDVVTTTEGVSGKFVGAALPGLPEGMDWNINYGTNIVSLVTTIPGDYNADGNVDAADYIVWRKTLGEAAVQGLGADGDLSGTIDDADYSVWRTNFGATAAGAAAVARSGATGSASANAAIPEPATLWLALTCIAFLLQLRHADSKCAH